MDKHQKNTMPDEASANAVLLRNKFFHEMVGVVDKYAAAVQDREEGAEFGHNQVISKLRTAITMGMSVKTTDMGPEAAFAAVQASAADQCIVVCNSCGSKQDYRFSAHSHCSSIDGHIERGGKHDFGKVSLGMVPTGTMSDEGVLMRSNVGIALEGDLVQSNDVKDHRVSEIGYLPYVADVLGHSVTDGCVVVSHDVMIENLVDVSGFNTGFTSEEENVDHVVDKEESVHDEGSKKKKPDKRPRWRPHKGQFGGRPRPTEDGKVLSYAQLRAKHRQRILVGLNASFDVVQPGSMMFYLTIDGVKYAVAVKIGDRFHPTAFFKQIMVDYNLTMGLGTKIMSLAAARTLSSKRDETSGEYYAKKTINQYRYMRSKEYYTDADTVSFTLMDRMIQYFNQLCCRDEAFVKVNNAVDESEYVMCHPKKIYVHKSFLGTDLGVWLKTSGVGTKISAILGVSGDEMPCSSPLCIASGCIHATSDCALWHMKRAHLRTVTHVCAGMGYCGGRRGRFTSEEELVLHFEKRHAGLWASMPGFQRRSAISMCYISQQNFPLRD